MIGLDTNVIVRLLTGDDPEQQQIAKEFLARSCSQANPARINRIVMVETVWVLERTYRYERDQIAGAIEDVLHTAEFQVEDRDAVEAALELYREGAGFSDALIAQTSIENDSETKIVTFDADAAKKIPSFQLLAA